MELNLTSPKNIKKIMAEHGYKPNKILGQNFLINKPTLNKIIKFANLTKDEIVLEIGPGLGTLTRELAKNTKKVITIEKDRKMVEFLRETLNDLPNVEILQGDILKFNDDSLLTKDYKLIANIPYYLTSPLIRKFLESEHQPKEIVLMIQKEVAQRICSAPPNMSLLSVAVQFYAKPKIVSYVSKNCFWPAPKIDSAIIKIIPYQENKNIDEKLFFKIVKAGFSQPRKQLSNNLSNNLKINRSSIDKWLLNNKIKPEQRAETLSIFDWQSLTKTYSIITNKTN